MKEVELLPDDPKSAECMKQLEQVIHRLVTNGIIKNYFPLLITQEDDAKSSLFTAFSFKDHWLLVLMNVQYEFIACWLIWSPNLIETKIIDN